MVERRTGNSGNNFIKAERTIRKPKFSNPFNKEFDSWDINGGAGKDTLIGGDKNDTLNGGTGIDSLEGRKGDDLYIVDNVNDKVIEQRGEGDNDAILSNVSFTLPANVEILNLAKPTDTSKVGYVWCW